MTRAENWTLASIPNRAIAPRKQRPCLMSDAQVQEASRLYLGERLSIYSIGHKMALQPETVRASLKRAGVAMRDKAEAQLARTRRAT